MLENKLNSKDLELYNKMENISNGIIEVKMDVMGKVLEGSYGELNDDNLYIKLGKIPVKQVKRILGNKLFKNSKKKNIEELDNNLRKVYIELYI